MRLSFALFLTSSLLFYGCTEYEDVDLPASRTFFFPASSSPVFQNLETGEQVTFNTNAVSCSQTGTSEVWQSEHKYKRYHSHKCKQIHSPSSTTAGILNNSIESQADYLRNSWKFNFMNSVFSFDEYGALPDNLPHHYIPSYEINGITYSNVAVLANESGYTGEAGFDTIYVVANKGVVRLITSTNQHWERQ